MCGQLTELTRTVLTVSVRQFWYLINIYFISVHDKNNVNNEQDWKTSLIFFLTYIISYAIKLHCFIYEVNKDIRWTEVFTRKLCLYIDEIILSISYYY